MSVTSHLEQKLAFLHFIAQPRVDFDDSSRGERGHRHLSRHIGIHHAGHVELGRGNVFARRCQRKPLGVIHLEIVRVQVGLHRDGQRTRAGLHLVLGVHLSLASGEEKAGTRAQSCHYDQGTIHCKTSRPTAMFI